MAKQPEQTKKDNLNPWLARVVFYPSIVVLIVAALLGVDRYFGLTPFVLVLLGLAGLTEFTYLFESLLDRVRRAEGHNVALRESLVTEQSARSERDQHTSSLKLLAERTVLEADRIKANADAEAEALLTQAQAEADRMRSEAETDAGRMRSDATSEIERLRSDAISEGERLKSESLRDAGEQWRQIEAARNELVQSRLAAAANSKERMQADLAAFQRRVNEQFEGLRAQAADLTRGWTEIEAPADPHAQPHEVVRESPDSDPSPGEGSNNAA